MTKTKDVEALTFYTKGPEFTNVIRDFIQSGKFDTVYEVLVMGGLPEHMIKDFFLYKYKFKGDSRTKEGLSVVKDNGKYEIDSILYHAMSTALNETQQDFLDLNHLRGNAKKNVEALYKAWGGKNELIKFLLPRIIPAEGFVIEREPNDRDGRSFNAAILQDGTMIRCGVQEHSSLYPLLKSLGLASAGDWTHDEETIHITDGQISGDIASAIKFPRRRESEVKDAQLHTLAKFKNQIKGEYGGYGTTMLLLQQYIDELENKGGKYNNLVFLKKFYPEFNLPEFSKEPLDSKIKQCIRTSPLYSLPGLLDSKFDINENSVKEIKKAFKKYKDVIADNELHYFYQEYIDGMNGVCHSYKDRSFSYALSETRGDIVKGKKGDVTLGQLLIKELQAIATKLSKDLEKSIQIEFVLTPEKKFFIVQLRVLNNNPEDTVIIKKPAKVLASGLTFSKGNIEVSMEDVLIVDKDGKSETLLGKKALIVRDEVEFSHLLALSKALNIPSMYGIGDAKLPEKGIVKFTAYNKESWITKV